MSGNSKKTSGKKSQFCYFSSQNPPTNLPERLTGRGGGECEEVGSLEDLVLRVATGCCEAVLVEGDLALRQAFLRSADGGEEEPVPLAEVERRHILHILGVTNGNKAAAARILDIDTKTLYNKLKRYGQFGRNGPASQARGRNASS